MRKRIVLLSPNPRGDYAICIAEMLARSGVDVSAIFVRRLANFGRLTHEIRAEGVGPFTRKIIRKFLFRKVGSRGRPFATLNEFKSLQGIPFGNLAEFARARSSRLIRCDEFNEGWVSETIATLAPDAVVFTGGGLVRQPLIDAADGRIVACHPGALPTYRGMHCLEWAMLEGHPEKIGFTTFLIDGGIDTGPILNIYRVKLQETDNTFADLRERLEPAICEAMVESVLGLLDGRIQPQPQDSRGGRQFFVMHNSLHSIAEEALRRECQK